MSGDALDHRSRSKLPQRKKKPPIGLRKVPLTVPRILEWIDAFHEHTGKWPNTNSGRIRQSAHETWTGIDQALRKGSRGLSGGRSLAQIIARYRNVINLANLPPLTEEQILAWADAFRERTGKWPKQTSGRISESPRENWMAIDGALYVGCRGLPGSDSLPRLLSRRRGARNMMALEKLTESKILAWADDHFRRTGRWPISTSGKVISTPETWSAINRALINGVRGLPGGSSLPRLLACRRGVRNSHALPALAEDQILAWADAHHHRTGVWPTHDSGPVSESQSDTWNAINLALDCGQRGLPGGSSIAQLLTAHRGVRNKRRPPPLEPKRILDWAQTYYWQHGKWPTANSGPIEGSNGETWAAVALGLTRGQRGLPGGSSLSKLLDSIRDRGENRGVVKSR